MPKQNDFSLEWNAPEAGDYDARVTNIDVIYSEPRAVRISYQTESDPIYGVSEYLPIDAPLRHPRYADTAQGKARIAQLARTAGELAAVSAQPEHRPKLWGVRRTKECAQS